MNNCTQCGKMNAANAVNCQSCGAPLSSMVDGGMSPRSASLGQPELPAWLESLRAGEHPASPANSGANFSAADFVDEDSLPSWMRAERNEARGNTGANIPVTLRPASSPGPTTDGERQQSTGIAARSLLDEQALPSWMREGKQSGPVSAQEKIAASSLVQSENMPDWMKSLHRDQASFSGETGGGTTPPASLSRPSQGSLPVPQMPASPQQPAAGYPNGSQSPQAPTTPAAFSGQAGFSARDLVDPQSLPSWMTTQQGGGQPGQPNQPSQASQAVRPDPSRNPGQAGFSARDLVDPQSLPSWMTTQQGGGQPGQPNQPSQASQAVRPDPSRNPGQAGFSARDLVDPQSLPSWMTTQQGGGQPGQPNQPSQASQAVRPDPSRNPGQAGFSARDLVDPQSLPSWMTQQSERPAQPNQPSQVAQPNSSRNPAQAAQGQTFSASSLLDANALPTWLRENGQGGNIQSQSGPIASQPFQTPSPNPPAAAFGGNIPASSLINANSAPEWMQQANLQQPQYGFAAPPQSAPELPPIPRTPPPNTYAGPPKVENVRVPNRPRHEINPNENSEVAANVFSSMLGVASSAPNYPAPSPQSQSPYQQPGSAGNPAQPNMAPPMSQSGMPSYGQYAGPSMGAIPNTPNISPNMPQGYTPGNSYGSSYQGGMSSSQAGNSPSANMQYAQIQNGYNPAQKAADTANEQKKAKKRGLFGAIFEWLTH